LQKAFDTVDHEILLEKLCHYDIRGRMHDWFKSYLSGRTQFTAIGQIHSKPENINFGVPQGSVLGPILFLIYMNDICNAVHGPKVKLFADDTNMFVKADNLNSLNIECNHYLAELNAWFLDNRLSLNIEKTVYLLFQPNFRKWRTNSLDLTIDGLKINQAISSKYLGIIIDERLNWLEHIDYVYKKLIKFIGIFYKLRNKMPNNCLKNLYFALVYPHLLFGIELYMNTFKSYFERLSVLNNKFLRILQREKIETPVKSLYANYNILPINLLFRSQLLLLVYKFMFHKELIPRAFHMYFVTNQQVHSHYTRSFNNLHLHKCFKCIGQRCFKYQGSKAWNMLPNNIKIKCSVSSFKKQVYTYLLST
jgi:hypothetical protein